MCVVCRKNSGKPYAMPDPPPLVKSRVSHTDPFTVTSTDFTGALHNRTTEGERKVYLCLFTCAVSRAVHLEIVSNLTVEYFLVDLLEEDLPSSSYCQTMGPHIYWWPTNSKAYFQPLNYQTLSHVKILNGGSYQNVLHGLVGFGNDS